MTFYGENFRLHHNKSLGGDLCMKHDPPVYYESEVCFVCPEDDAKVKPLIYYCSLHAIAYYPQLVGHECPQCWCYKPIVDWSDPNNWITIMRRHGLSEKAKAMLMPGEIVYMPDKSEDHEDTRI